MDAASKMDSQMQQPDILQPVLVSLESPGAMLALAGVETGAKLMDWLRLRFGQPFKIITIPDCSNSFLVHLVFSKNRIVILKKLLRLFEYKKAVCKIKAVAEFGSGL